MTKMLRPVLLLFTLLPLLAQESPWDSLNIQYRLIQNHYQPFEDIIKIKLPPYLSTSEVMEQVKLAVQWPGDPPPRKKTIVYVFKEDAAEGDVSRCGGMYLPGKGFKWDLGDWKPDTSVLSYTPSYLDRLIYNTFLDSMFTNGMYTFELEEQETPTKHKIARHFAITVGALDSIYYHVKWWASIQKSRQRK